jgi:hypothetical protein
MKSLVKSFVFAVATLTIQSSVLFSQWAFDTAITTGTNTSGIAITSDGSKVIVTNNTNPGSVAIVSTADYSVVNVDISATENYPNGVAILPNDSVAIVCTMHKVVYVNLYSHTVTGSFTAPCAGTTLYGVAVTPNGLTAAFPDLSSGCTQQGLRLIDATHPASSSTFIQIGTSGILYGVAVTPNGASALITTNTSDSPKLVNISTSAVQNITGFAGSYGAAILHDGSGALIFDGDSLDRVSFASNTITKKISALSYNTSFENIAITSDNNYAFAVGAFEKLIVALANDSVVQTFTAGGTNVATNADGSTFYVTDSYNGAVRVYKRQTTNGIANVQERGPATYSLQQNYPNPFNPTTSIEYTLPKESRVFLAVYDGLGRKVMTLVDGVKPSGSYRVTFNAASLASGTYFYRFQSGDYSETKKLLFLK